LAGVTSVRRSPAPRHVWCSATSSCGAGKRQRADQDGVQERERGRGRSDSERRHRDGNEGEPWSPAQAPKGPAKILAGLIDSRTRPVARHFIRVLAAWRSMDLVML